MATTPKRDDANDGNDATHREPRNLTIAKALNKSASPMKRAVGAVRAGISTVLVQHYNQVDYYRPDVVESLYYKYLHAGLAYDARADNVPRIYHDIGTPWTTRRIGTCAEVALCQRHLQRLRGGGLSRPDESAVAVAADSPEDEGDAIGERPAESVHARGGSTGTTRIRVSFAYVSRRFPVFASHILGVAMNFSPCSETRRSKRRPRVCCFSHKDEYSLIDLYCRTRQAKRRAYSRSRPSSILYLTIAKFGNGSRVWRIWPIMQPVFALILCV